MHPGKYVHASSFIKMVVSHIAMCVQMDTSYRFSGAESVEPTVQMMSTMTLHLKAIRQSGKSNQLTPAGYPYRLSLLFHSRSQLEKSLKKLLQKKRLLCWHY